MTATTATSATAATTAPLRIGIMSFAHVHTPGFVALLTDMGCQLVGADSDPDRAKASAERYGIEVVDDYATLLDRELDGVVICAENVYHRELTELAAAAGVYVLTEKPIATTIADGRAMIDACDKAGVGLMTAFPMRWSPPLARLVSLAKGGRLGQVVAMSGTNPGTCPGGWFADPALSGGGSVVDHTVHVGDLMCEILGAMPVSVYAQTNALITPDFGIETGGLISITFSDGTIGTIDASWSRLPTYPTWGGVTLEVVGTDGVIAVDAFADRASLYSQKASWLNFGTDPNRGMVAEFLSSIREKRMPTPSGTDGLNASAIAVAAYKSAATHAVVATFED
jgi:predicted dehydrogenase